MPLSTPHLSGSDDLAQDLHSVTIQLLRGLRRADDAAGLTGPRLSALSVVVHSGSLTLGDLANAEQVRPPTMTRIVNALEERGLIIKSKGPNDARKTLLSATLRGKKLLLRGRDRRVQPLSTVIDALTPGERAALRECLQILRKLANGIKT